MPSTSSMYIRSATWRPAVVHMLTLIGLEREGEMANLLGFIKSMILHTHVHTYIHVYPNSMKMLSGNCYYLEMHPSRSKQACWFLATLPTY